MYWCFAREERTVCGDPGCVPCWRLMEGGTDLGQQARLLHTEICGKREEMDGFERTQFEREGMRPWPGG